MRNFLLINDTIKFNSNYKGVLCDGTKIYDTLGYHRPNLITGLYDSVIQGSCAYYSCKLRSVKSRQDSANAEFWDTTDS